MVHSTLETKGTRIADLSNAAERVEAANLEVALLTGGIDPPYVFGLTMALIAKGIRLDVIGSDKLDRAEMHTTPGLKFLNLQSTSQANQSRALRTRNLLAFYVRLLRYALTAKPKIFHILWNNKLEFFDRTLLMLYFKMLRKKIVLTAHNVNTRARDGNDSALNRFSLKVQYRLVDHIFVHTQKMKDEIIGAFGPKENAVSVIPFGVNNAVPHTELTPAEAKRRLGVLDGDKTMLFFGAIRPSKGLEYLVDAFGQLAAKHANYRLIIAGERKSGYEQYVDSIRLTISRNANRNRVIEAIQYVPDADTELYFKAADVAVLPYTDIFQSGVLFLSYSFGLPVIATDVGSFADDVAVGRTGFLCKPCDSADLARTIENYFESELFQSLHNHREEIQDHVRARHSWDVVGKATRGVYAGWSGKVSSTKAIERVGTIDSPAWRSFFHKD
jgi:glycosyltransferase involved in cell wall biosynthesis